MPLAFSSRTARPLRLCFAGAWYHVMVRGNAKALLFLDADDCRRLLEILHDTARRFLVVVHAFCFMPNHYHLVVQTRGANLSAVMAFLNGVYAQWWNRRHGRCGHVTQGRFKAQLVQNERYLAAVCRYVMDNPVRAGLVEHAEDWEWSSYRAAAGLVAVPSFLDTSLAGRLVASDARSDRASHEQDASTSRSRYDQEIARAVRGDARFIGEPSLPDSRTRIAEEARSAGFSRREWRAFTPPLADVFAGCTDSRSRNGAILEAHRKWRYTQVQIAEHLGLHRDSVGRLIRGSRRRGRHRMSVADQRMRLRGSHASAPSRPSAGRVAR